LLPAPQRGGIDAQLGGGGSGADEAALRRRHALNDLTRTTCQGMQDLDTGRNKCKTYERLQDFWLVLHKTRPRRLQPPRPQ
jgi:hypothetical protein